MLETGSQSFLSESVLSTIAKNIGKLEWKSNNAGSGFEGRFNVLRTTTTGGQNPHTCSTTDVPTYLLCAWDLYDVQTNQILDKCQCWSDGRS